MSTQTSQSSDTTYQPNPTESALMNNELQLSNAALPGQLQNIGQAQNLQSSLLTGQNLPGYLNMLPQGVSQGQSMNEAQLGLQALAPQFQAMGGLDSGSYAQAGANAFANTLNSNAQFNVQNLAQLLNLASGQAYQNVGNAATNNSTLGQQSGALAGQNSRSTLNQNPFLNSFYSGLGTQASGNGSSNSTGGIMSLAALGAF